MFGVRTSFPTSFWSARSEFIPFQEPEPEEGQEEKSMFNEEPCMDDKRFVLDKREKLKGKKKEQRERATPGYKLLKKLHQEQQIEDSLVRVIRNLTIH